MKSFVFLFLLIVACAPQLAPKLVECTEEVKLCPDGSAVSRIPPSCGFAPCPAQSFCNVDDDCACGTHKDTGECFVGSKEFVNVEKQCPDFCTGIAGHLETRCVKNECKTVQRTTNYTLPTTDEEPTANVQDLSSAHWQCESGKWVGSPEQCAENVCVSNSDCQILGVKGVCGPYKIVVPKSMHKPPVFYEGRCGSEKCSLVMAMCAEPGMLPVIRNVKCDSGRCVGVYDVAQKECDSAQDCVKNSCCHATACVPKFASPSCEGVACTMDCKPGTLDCGGSCGCIDGRCVGVKAE
ncbi:hypothetical protein HY489_06060 [Candidatus Woesearchaeota archaeon]|nr:hypothetical protein [Candidatus Woesearchaeota archaeon]